MAYSVSVDWHDFVVGSSPIPAKDVVEKLSAVDKELAEFLLEKELHLF